MNLQPANEGFQKELGKGLAIRLLRIVDILLLLVVAIIGILHRDNPTVLLTLLLVAAGLLLLLLLSFVLLSLRKFVVPPMAARQPAPTPQQIRQQEINQMTQVLSEHPKPSEKAFEVLKILAMNPRDASFDVHGISYLPWIQDFQIAKSCLQELKDLGYVQRSGPAMPGEGNNYYQISQKGIHCVNFHAA